MFFYTSENISVIDFGKKKEHLKNSILNLFGHKVGSIGDTVSHLSNGAAEVADDMEELAELLSDHSTNSHGMTSFLNQLKQKFNSHLRKGKSKEMVEEIADLLSTHSKSRKPQTLLTAAILNAGPKIKLIEDVAKEITEIITNRLLAIVSIISSIQIFAFAKFYLKGLKMRFH